jgi:hypothetical protein
LLARLRQQGYTQSSQHSAQRESLPAPGYDPGLGTASPSETKPTQTSRWGISGADVEAGISTPDGLPEMTCERTGYFDGDDMGANTVPHVRAPGVSEGIAATVAATVAAPGVDAVPGNEAATWWGDRDDADDDSA